MSTPFTEQNPLPPKMTEKFLTWCLPKSLKEPVAGDLSEEFSGKAVIEGLSEARVWYFRQAFLTAFRYLFKTKRGLFMFIFGILTFLGTLLMALLMSGELDMFVNIPSFLVVVPPALFITIGISSKQTCKQALLLMLDDELEASLTELKSAKQMFQVLGNTSVL